MSSHFAYFVEGPCEKALIKAFMFSNPIHFQEGIVKVLNFTNERISKAFARTIARGSKIVIIVDTDVERNDVLEENISTLINTALIKREDIFIVLSVNNFEDEIVRSCDGISNINQVFSTNGIGEFKKKFIAHGNLEGKLLDIKFDIKKIWVKEANNFFKKYKNDGNKIKRKGN